VSVEVFISYSHKDKELREELHEHLSNLIRQGAISAWYDCNIAPGTEWENQTYEHLESAQVILLLISAGFMSSDFCYSREMKRAIVRHEANEARVIPILLRPVDYENAPFERLQMLPSGGKPVRLWQDQDEALKNVVQGIKKAIHDLEANAKPPQAKQDQIPLTPDVVDKEYEQPEPAPGISNIPFRRNRLFTGRDEALAQLHQAFTNGKQAVTTHLQVISGLGGIGKTQTALEYAYRYQTSYKYILWVKAHTHELLVSDLASLATLLDLPLKDEKDQNLTAAVVKRWLQTHDGWLLVLDNTDNLRATIDFLPTDAKGHFLLTAREPASGSELRRIELPNLTRDQSALFLLRRALLIELDTPLTEVSELDLHKAREISEMLGDLPLALAQAGAYIEKTRCGLAGYIERYRVRRTKLLQDNSGLSDDHPEPVATTWSLSFDKLGPASGDLLRLCAFLHPDAIPEEIITEGAVELGPALQSIGEDIFALDDAIVELLRYSLVRRNQDEKTLTVHRLVQAVLKDAMQEDTQHKWEERAIRATNRVFPEFSFTVQERCKRYVSHVQTCAEWITQWQMIFPEAVQLLGKAGHYLYERGQYKEAEPLLDQVLRLYERMGETQLLNVAYTLNLLAELYRHQGKYTQALPLYKRALAIREQLLDPMHSDVATSLNNLARPYHHQAEYQEAEQLYLRALKIRQQLFEAEHADLAHSLNDLARLYKDQGKYEQAKELCQRALEIRERVLGPDHPDTATSLSGLALFYQVQGKYEQAETLYQRAFNICECVLGPDHPDTAAILNNQAGLYQVQGKYEQAETLYQRALGICERVLGPDHPDTAISLNNQAGLYQAQGKYTQAKQHYQRALEICQKVLGPKHPDTATNLSNLGGLYRGQGQYVQAKQYYQRALVIREQVLGAKHPDTAATLHGLAILYTQQRNYAQAEPHYKRAISICEHTLGDEHPNTIQVLTNYAGMLRAAKRNTKAAETKARIAAAQAKRKQEHSQL